MRLQTFFIILISLVLGAVPAQAQKHPQDGNTVVKAARDWLVLIDEEDYETAWAQSSETLQEKSTQSAWIQEMRGYREKVGSVRQRTLAGLNRQPKTGIKPHAAIVYFGSEYRNASIHFETLYVVLESGIWKVAGYYAKLEGRRKE